MKMNTPDVRTLQLEHRWKVILDVYVFSDCAACRCWFPLLSFHFFYFSLFITAAPGLILWYQQHYLIFIFFKLFCHFSKFVCILKPAISWRKCHFWNTVRWIICQRRNKISNQFELNFCCATKINLTCHSDIVQLRNRVVVKHQHLQV
jgi:hypothetical protein